MEYEAYDWYMTSSTTVAGWVDRVSDDIWELNQSLRMPSTFKYRPGDKVICLTHMPDGNPEIIMGSTGTVVVYEEGSYPPIGVEWDHQMRSGHNLRGNLPSGSTQGWFVKHEQIALLSRETEDAESACEPGSEEELVSLFS